jgi:hypothetical protein
MRALTRRFAIADWKLDCEVATRGPLANFLIMHLYT